KGGAEDPQRKSPRSRSLGSWFTTIGSCARLSVRSHPVQRDVTTASYRVSLLHDQLARPHVISCLQDELVLLPNAIPGKRIVLSSTPMIAGVVQGVRNPE